MYSTIYSVQSAINSMKSADDYDRIQYDYVDENNELIRKTRYFLGAKLMKTDDYDYNGNQIKKINKSGQPIPKKDDETGEILRDEVGKIKYLGRGEGIKVADSKHLIDLIENKSIENWIKHPVFGYLIPSPIELEEKHDMTDFRKRFNPLNYYTPKQYLDFIKRDIKERTEFLEDLFKGQYGEKELKDIINIWKKCKIPTEKEIKEFYNKYYK